MRGNGRVVVSTLVLAAFAVAGAGVSMAEEKEIQITPKAAAPAAQPAKPAAPAAAKPAAPAAAKPAGGGDAANAGLPQFPAPGAAPPAGGVKPDGTAKSAWVKLCEKAPIVSHDKDGKEVKDEKNICLTHHERLDGNTGMVLVSAAIRQIEGQDKQALMVMVPLGMMIPPGMRAGIYPKDLWEKLQKNEKVDDSKLKGLALNYTLCHPAGCTAEMEATPDLINDMKAGGGLVVGEPTEFRFLSSTTRRDDHPGVILDGWSADEIAELAPIADAARLGADWGASLRTSAPARAWSSHSAWRCSCSTPWASAWDASPGIAPSMRPSTTRLGRSQLLRG